MLPSSGRVLMAQACKLAERLPLQAGVTAAVTANTHTHHHAHTHTSQAGEARRARVPASCVRSPRVPRPTQPLPACKSTGSAPHPPGSERQVRTHACLHPSRARARRHTATLTHSTHSVTHTHAHTHSHTRTLAHAHAHQSTAGRHVRLHTPPLGRPAAPRAGLACVLTDLPAGVWVRAEDPKSAGRRGRGTARAGRRSRRGKHGLLRGTRPLSARPRGASSAEAGLGFLC